MSRMLRAAWKSVLGHKARLLMSLVAVSLGVAFVSGTLTFTDSMGRAFNGLMDGTMGDVMVRQKDVANLEQGQGLKAVITPDALAKVQAVPGVKEAVGEVSEINVYPINKQGKVMGGWGPPALGGSFHSLPSQNGGRGPYIVEGRAPVGMNEVVLDPRTLKSSGYQIGEQIKVVSPAVKGPKTYTIVGTVLTGNGTTGGASFTFFDTKAAQDLILGGQDLYHDIWVVRDDSVSQEELASRINALGLGDSVEVVTGHDASESAREQVQAVMGQITTFMLVFAAIALVVGTFLIVNTFSILVAQRTRELALFRALGARRKQVLRGVLFEALVVGIVGSTVGIGLGLGLARVLFLLLDSIGMDMGSAGVMVTPQAIIVGYLIGIAVTILAAYLPARRGSRVAPVVAMGADAGASSGSLARRAVIGIGMVAVGVVGMVLGLFTDIDEPLIFLGLGALLVLLGVAMTSPLLGKPVILGLGAVYRKIFGSVGHLAETNSVRNPKRTAATASALMIGLTLVTTMSIVGASFKESVRSSLETQQTADLVVMAPMGAGLSPLIGDDISAAEGVEAIGRLRLVPGEISGIGHGVTATDRSYVRDIVKFTFTQGSADDFTGENVVAVSNSAAQANGWTVGQSIPAKLNSQDVSLRIMGTYDADPGLAGDAVVTLETGNAAGVKPSDAFVLVKAKDGVDTAALEQRLNETLKDNPLASVRDVNGYAEEMNAQIDQMLTMLYALLGLAVVIAVLGIINTLALSVIERTREIGLLRAVGLNRAQLSVMIALESVAIALLGAMLGLGMGVVFGSGLQRSLADEGLSSLAIPWLQLAFFLLGAAVVGVLAAIWPAVRASRMNVLRAIATE